MAPPCPAEPGEGYREGYRYRRQMLVSWSSDEVHPHAVTCYAGQQISDVTVAPLTLAGVGCLWCWKVAAAEDGGTGCSTS